VSEKEPGRAAPSEDVRRAAMRAASRRIDRVNDRLHLGGAITAEEYRRFSDGGITHIVDLREDSEVDSDLARLREMNIEHLQVPVPNHGAPSTGQLQTLVEWLDSFAGEPVVYVHCGGGFGRAATMAVALLVQEGASVDAAIDQVRKARPEIRINDDQLKWLKEIEDRLR